MLRSYSAVRLAFMTLRTLLAPAALAAAVALTAGGALAVTGSQYASQAKITMAQARTIALKAVPGGKITAAELEKEQGGSGLRYSFDIKVDGKTREVGVDAKTGKVLENAQEGANPD